MDFRCDEMPERIEDSIRRWRPLDRLSPEPPYNWFIVWDIPTKPCALDATAWLNLVAAIQHLDERPFVSRKPDGGRVLLCSPRVRYEMAEAVYSVLGSFECSCGGTDCLDRANQERIRVLFSRRGWRRASLGLRIQIAQFSDDDDPMEIALSDDPVVLERIDDLGALDAIADER